MTEAELKSAYEAQKPLLAAWGSTVKEEVLSRLEKAPGLTKPLAEFLKIPVEPRVKATDSFLAKALRRGKDYERPLDQITDKVGVRFVVLLLSELKLIEDVIEGCELWEAEKARDFEAERAERPHHFDYQSVHYIAHPKKPLECGGVTVPVDIACEIQVRTLLQHAYAELAHDTTYKTSFAVDREVSRQIAKSAALVEATDEIFVFANAKVQAASAELRRVHELTASVYQAKIGLTPIPDLRLSYSLLDPYREQVTAITPGSLDEFFQKNDFIADRVKERAPLSLFYRHPSVLALYFLIANHPDLVPKHWPADRTHLEMIYSDLGLSTENRLW